MNKVEKQVWELDKFIHLNHPDVYYSFLTNKEKFLKSIKLLKVKKIPDLVFRDDGGIACTIDGYKSNVKHLHIYSLKKGVVEYSMIYKNGILRKGEIHFE